MFCVCVCHRGGGFIRVLDVLVQGVFFSPATDTALGILCYTVH